jgi:23S rRNA U2552 (ribose-2'-O)-methylase RlmE/FtsJ
MKNVTTMQQDVFSWKPQPELQQSVDVLMSDMAPDVTGKLTAC